ncbi:MAG: divergent PAP2 family protein [Oscillospiraceae bacterium]
MVNKILVLAVAAWAVAQVLKFLISMAVYHKFDINYLITSGGMPSSHSALVCSCATATAVDVGIQSPMFAIAVVLAFIVMYDAAHVRRETGEQAKVLNYIMRNWNEVKPEEFEDELKELIGHTPLQVAIGAVLGVTVGILGGLVIFPQ